MARQHAEPRLPSVVILMPARAELLDVRRGPPDVLGVPEQQIAAADRVARSGRRTSSGGRPARRSRARGQNPPGASIASDDRAIAAAPDPRGAAAPAGHRPPRPATMRNEAAAASGVRLRTAHPGAAAPTPRTPRRTGVRRCLRSAPRTRIHRRLDRPLAQQIRAEAVDGADVRLFEPLYRPLQPPRAVTRGAAASRARSSSSRRRSLSSPAAFSLKVTATISIDALGAAGLDQPDHAFDELRRLAGARRGLDDQRVVQRFADEVSVVRRHGIFRSSSRSAIRPAGFRSVRCSSSGRTPRGSRNSVQASWPASPPACRARSRGR